ncbi:GAF and ANTAR domain-containing protein [Arthrobacter flavus]
MAESSTAPNQLVEAIPGSVDYEDMAEQLSEFARVLQADNDADSLLTHLVKAAIELVPGTDEASISLITGRADVESRAPSSDLPRQVDALQTRVGQGPCLDAVFEHGTVSVPDMAQEDRWPRFAEGAMNLGAASMLAFQLYVEGDNLGAMNLYSRHANAFTVESEENGLLIAAHASVAIAGSKKMDQMHDALANRDTIGQAKGILMERFGITANQAFILLVRSSSHTNTKLATIAEYLTGTGELPHHSR